MATVISCATGNWSSSTTWALIDSTSYLDSETGSTASTTSYVYSSTFIPGAITIDGIAIKVASPGASGTLNIELFNHTDTLTVANTTVNNIDLQIGWNFIKFSASQTLIAAKAYKVGVKHVTASSSLYRDSTAGNWSRLLRTTTTQAPVANDQIVIAGELTGAGAGNTLTVTLDNTASTSYGTTAYTQSIHVSNRGTLTCATSASTAYQLKHKGVFQQYAGSTINLGTVGVPMPSSSSLTLTADVAANVDTGWVFGAGTSNIYGNSVATTTTRLTSDLAVSGTVWTVASSSGWSVGDVIGIASTTTNNAQFEARTILTVDSATQATMTSGATNAHSGTNSGGYDYRAYVVNMTRNIKFNGISTSLQGYILIGATTTFAGQYFEAKWMGSGTTNKRGFDIYTTTGTVAITGAALHDFVVSGSSGFGLAGGSGTGVNLQSCVTYNINSYHHFIAQSTGTQIVNNCTAIGSVANTAVFYVQDVGGTVTGCVAASCNGGGAAQFLVFEQNQIATFNNNVACCNGQNGFAFLHCWGAVDHLTTWRCAQGFDFEEVHSQLTLDLCTSYGHTNAHVQSNGQAGLTKGWQGDVIFTNSAFDAGLTTVTPSVFLPTLATPGWSSLILESCTLGSITAHTQEFNLSVPTFIRAILRNCVNTSATYLTSQSNMLPGSYVLVQKYNQTAADHRAYTAAGTTRSDTVIYNTASPSQRLTPANASSKLQSSVPTYGWTLAVASGATANVSVYVRKSVVGDGTAYNGNQARLIVRKNVAAGITSDTVLATASGAAGTWEQLSGTTTTVNDAAKLEFYVDCDGTTGWVNVDDFASTTINDTKGFKYWSDGLPSVQGDNSTNGPVNFAY
ncbi:MAG: hypothetical protein JWN86_1764 [Planctomycetota bacterium]|nr:hypothetical protein [Planctomycetota bacterium]